MAHREMTHQGSTEIREHRGALEEWKPFPESFFQVSFFNVWLDIGSEAHCVVCEILLEECLDSKEIMDVYF